MSGWAVLCADGENRMDEEPYETERDADAAAEASDAHPWLDCGPHRVEAVS